MRKFILNPAVISSLFGVTGVIHSTRSGPRNWMLALQWIAWATNVALAIGGVVAKDQETRRR
ncbi:hypothetical protein [Schumannella soli]|uniref:Uncharacterized protein n=1 Tax=Schumannella soli TaxID=2590779 RepID=A0A506Y4G0_9MICO|nr:hypothetical protein [Schumannella soli]TPW77476.1 hypothetical protein FJ657_01995 [Schumannella soli]